MLLVVAASTGGVEAAYWVVTLLATRAEAARAAATGEGLMGAGVAAVMAVAKVVAVSSEEGAWEKEWVAAM